MVLKSNFPLREKSIIEFIRILLPEAVDKDVEIVSSENDGKIKIEVQIDGKIGIQEIKNYENVIEDQKVIMTKTALLKAYNKKYPWGGLIGVRPSKMTRKLFLMGFLKGEVKEILTELYLVTKEKIELILEVLETEEKLLNKEAMNLYIGIPFCPSKCKYCSFASYEINSALGKYYPGFVETLLKEIEIIGDYSSKREFKYESLYIGGGTPSTLTEEDTVRVLEAIHKYIDTSNLKEFTFEAGREDSITTKKLEILKRYGVDRVSLNPQTFNEVTLSNLNRKFNRENFDKVYSEIKEIGFILNMDIILGLPGEGVSDILSTLDELEKYDIENLTIHSLALKKGSNLYRESFEESDVDRITIENRIKKLVENKGMHPYYMYRQKNSLDWGENVGYSKPGFESRFNIEMIEENQSTMGLGGGAISKTVVYETEVLDQITRLVNPKDPALYIREMIERNDTKMKLFDDVK
ncbi:MAG: coproporphyrinogen III oxidase [Cetobacterium sp.]|uniref:coproporphyrinogen III oxidase n=1 Tax=Cetobacterium sp. TaxID=2071632 RepID=UPI002FC65946